MRLCLGMLALAAVAGCASTSGRTTTTASTEVAGPPATPTIPEPVPVEVSASDQEATEADLAAGEPAEEALGFDLGAVDFITKPINPVTVKARVRTHLELKLQQDLLRSIALIDGLTDAEFAENRRLVSLGEPGVP